MSEQKFVFCKIYLLRSQMSLFQVGQKHDSLTHTFLLHDNFVVACRSTGVAKFFHCQVSWLQHIVITHRADTDGASRTEPSGAFRAAYRIKHSKFLPKGWVVMSHVQLSTKSSVLKMSTSDKWSLVKIETADSEHAQERLNFVLWKFQAGNIIGCWIDARHWRDDCWIGLGTHSPHWAWASAFVSVVSGSGAGKSRWSCTKQKYRTRTPNLSMLLQSLCVPARYFADISRNLQALCSL